jgi:hypothetical protein
MCNIYLSLQQHLRQNQSEQLKKLNTSNSNSGDTEVLQRIPGAPCDCGAEAMLLEVMTTFVTICFHSTCYSADWYVNVVQIDLSLSVVIVYCSARRGLLVALALHATQAGTLLQTLHLHVIACLYRHC